MDLIERDVALRELHAALGEAARGEGRVALVSGEAGIGKTALVERFARVQGAAVRVLWGACDALFTPRPYGPVHDIAAQTRGSLPALLTGTAERAAILTAMLDELRGRPVLAVFEDVHWADEATLDLLRFLGRRIARTAALLVLTYRDDELGPGHPLRTVLGDLASSSSTVRIPLSPLSEPAVRALVGHRSIDVAALHRQTGGNPVFVSEVLSSTGTGLPLTIRDAVLGRVARLSPSAQTVLDAAAVVGPRIEPWLLDAMIPSDAQAADECLDRGVLVAQGEGLAFRHEVARQTVVEAIAPVRRALLHRRALDALRAPPCGGPDLTRLAHHAEGAGDPQAILSYAPAAARHASAAGAHRAAAVLLGLALPCAAALPAAELAALFEAHAWASLLIQDWDSAIASRRRAVELWRDASDTKKQGENLAMLAGAFIAAGRRHEARQASQAAIDLLVALPPGRELALAYRLRAVLHQFNHDLAEAIDLAERAISLAEESGDALITARAYDTLGLASMYLDYERGREYLERARDIAREAGLDSEVARAYAELGSNSVELFHLDRAERDLSEGLAYTAERDLDYYHFYMVVWMAATKLYRGRWSEAAAVIADVLRSQAISGNARWIALIALGRVQVRRDGASSPSPLDDALDLAFEWGEFHMTGPVRAARAEAAWLAGDAARTLAEADAAYLTAVEKQHHWLAGELAYWRWCAGAAETPPDWIAAPFALQIAGDWRAAADTWQRLGCPYEAARALADGDAAAQEQALSIFDQLGARPAAATLRRTMRARGVVRLPRGPRPTTRANRFGLTTRQLEIIGLLAEGCSNVEIAGRLSIAPKTAEHHVAAVLAKLDVASRQAAVRLARSQQLIAER